MKHLLSIMLLCLFVATVLFSCTKHAGDTDEETAPAATLTMTSPMEGAVYQSGDSVLIQGLAISTADIHGYEVSIKNAADTSMVYYAAHIHDHNDTIAINQKWNDTLTKAANLQVEVRLTLDHDGHTLRKSIGIKTQN